MNFTCKYCGRHATITNPDAATDRSLINTRTSKYGKIALYHYAITCPNKDCKELHLKAELISFDEEYISNGKYQYKKRKSEQTWNLLPQSSAKPIPEYVPEEIRNNYYEACLIADSSPKASAAMSRRTLQGIVRDFFQIPNTKRGNLGAEISFISDKVDPDTLESIKAVREVGDIGAHMEKSVDTIVDVEPGEAQLLIELIETLISDWYVDRWKRSQRNEKLRSVVKEKREAKRIAKDTSKLLKDKTTE